MFFHEISISCWTNRFELNAKKHIHNIDSKRVFVVFHLSHRIACMGMCVFYSTPPFNWRQFMGNNFMACSEASNFGLSEYKFSVCLSLKKHFIAFFKSYHTARWIRVSVTLSLSLSLLLASICPIVHFIYLFPIKMRIETFNRM